MMAPLPTIVMALVMEGKPLAPGYAGALSIAVSEYVQLSASVILSFSAFAFALLIALISPGTSAQATGKSAARAGLGQKRPTSARLRQLSNNCVIENWDVRKSI
ncbi:MAG: hypothetical protein KDE50_34590 [Caldilineaceae bacterium]|nr:hypothetical protein [Caldilineaceae bacterium]